MTWAFLGSREFTHRAETARFKVPGERFWREGTEGKVKRERLLCKLLRELVSIENNEGELLGKSEKLVASSENSRFGGGIGWSPAVVTEEEELKIQDRNFMLPANGYTVKEKNMCVLCLCVERGRNI